MLLIVAPFASTLLALRWFSGCGPSAAAGNPLAFLGRMDFARSRLEADAPPAVRHERDHGLAAGRHDAERAGPRTRISRGHAAAAGRSTPEWLSVLHFAMTFDAVLFASLYMIAFVAALRRAPLFPASCSAIWIGDLAMQFVTARLVTASGRARRRRIGPAHDPRRQCEEGADQRRDLVAVPASLDAGERHLPSSRAGLGATTSERPHDWRALDLSCAHGELSPTW